MSGWRAEGACYQTPKLTPLFFWPLYTDAAKRICAGCPVKAQCLAEALANDEQGVWGETTEAERHNLRRKH